MSADESSRGFFLRRWSRRKHEAARAATAPAPDAVAPPSDAVTARMPAPPSEAMRETSAPPADAASLLPVESLTIDSDFSAYLDPKVDKALKLQALKQLFRDPHFNVMDGLDVYIYDYSIADPIAPDVVRQLAQARYIFDPPRTRVTEAGVVEDIPAEEPPADAGPEAPEALPEPDALAPVPAMPNAAADGVADSGAGVATPNEGSEPARR